MAATWLGWPVLDHREELWGAHYEAVCQAFGLQARTIARYQRCIVAAPHDAGGPGPGDLRCERDRRAHRGGRQLAARLWPHLPSSTRTASRRRRWVSASTHGGEKYHPHDGCRRAAQDIATLAQVPLVKSDMVLEGGALLRGRAGRPADHRKLPAARQPQPPHAQAGHRGRTAAHAGRGEDHLAARQSGRGRDRWACDGIASFTAPARIPLQCSQPRSGPTTTGPCRRTARALELATDARGRPFEILDLPVPRDAHNYGSARFCDIYSNYILVNGAVISTRLRGAAGRAGPARSLPVPSRIAGWNCCPSMPSRWAAVPRIARRRQQPMLGNRLAVCGM
jgi:agmatine deiminase